MRCDKVVIPAKFVCVGESVYKIFLAPDTIWGEEVGGDRRLSPPEARRILEEGTVLAEDTVVCRIVTAVKVPGKAPATVRKLEKANAVKVGDQLIPLEVYNSHYAKFETKMYVPYSE